MCWSCIIREISSRNMVGCNSEERTYPVRGTSDFVCIHIMACSHCEHLPYCEHLHIRVYACFWLLFREIICNMVIKWYSAFISKQPYGKWNERFGDRKHSVKSVFRVWCIVAFHTYFTMSHNNYAVHRKVVIFKLSGKADKSCGRYSYILWYYLFKV